MKTLFIDPPGWQSQGYNLGLCLLCGVTASLGGDPLIMDLGVLRFPDTELERVARARRPEVVGISIKSSRYEHAINLAIRYRRWFPQAVLVAGGPHITIAAEAVLRETENLFNYLFMGEGEEAWAYFLKNFSNGDQREDFPGIISPSSFRAGKPLTTARINNLESLHYPRLDFFYHPQTSNHHYHLLTSRGCPETCGYCCVPSLAGRRFRSRTPQHIVAELFQARDRYGIEEFEIDDDNFTFDLERAKSFCRLLKKRGWKQPWSCPNGLRVDRLDEELIQLLAAAGCRSLALGLESGDPNILALNGKHINQEAICTVAQKIKAAGMRLTGFYMLGLPHSTLSRDLKSLAAANRLPLDYYIFNAFVPYPTTTAGNWTQSHARMQNDYRRVRHYSGPGMDFCFDTPGYPLSERRFMYNAVLMARERRWPPADGALPETVQLDAQVLLIEVPWYAEVCKLITKYFPGAKITHLRADEKMIRITQFASGKQTTLKEIKPTRGRLGKLHYFLKLRRLLVGMDFNFILTPRLPGYLLLALTLDIKNKIVYDRELKMKSISE